jgi:hypothetical protein
LTGQPPVLSSTPAEEPSALPETQALQVERPQAQQSPPEPERAQGMEIVYPRCCGLRVQRRQVIACLRLYDAIGKGHKEVRRFGTQPPELLALSNWLVAHRVSHAAIAETGVYWPRVYRALEPVLTLRLVKDLQDVEVIAHLLARGLVQDRASLPPAVRNLLHYSRRMLVAMIAVIILATPTTYQVWRHPAHAGFEQPPVEPPRMVRWQQPEISEQYPAGTQFTVRLPALERIPDGLPVEVTLAPPSDLPSWLQFDRERLHLRGIAPITAEDRTYQLLFLARAEPGSESRLPVSLTIRGQSEPPPSPAKTPSPPRAPAPPPPDRPADEERLLKILPEGHRPLRAKPSPTLEVWEPSMALPYTQHDSTRLEANSPTNPPPTLTREHTNNGGFSLTGPFRFRLDSEDIHLNSDLEIERNISLALDYSLTQSWNVGLYVPILPVRRFGVYSQPTMVDNFAPRPVSHRVLGDGNDPSIGNIVFHSYYSLPHKRPEWPELEFSNQVTLPTGDKDSLPGSRETNVQALLMASRSFGLLAPRVNLGFEWTRHESEQHNLLYGVGLGANVHPKLTLGLDLAGSREFNGPGAEGRPLDLILGATWNPFHAFSLDTNILLPIAKRDGLSIGPIGLAQLKYLF